MLELLEVRHPITILAIRPLVTQERPTFFFLIKTKNKEEVSEQIKRMLKFQLKLMVNPGGIAGGLALFRNDKVSIEIESDSIVFMDLICTLEESKQRMRVTFLHAPNDYAKHLQLWGGIRYIGAIKCGPLVQNF